MPEFPQLWWFEKLAQRLARDAAPDHPLQTRALEEDEYEAWHAHLVAWQEMCSGTVERPRSAANNLP